LSIENQSVMQVIGNQSVTHIDNQLVMYIGKKYV